MAHRLGIATRVALALAVCGPASCTGASTDPIVEETTGALGQGRFRWRCVAASDPTCGTGFFPWQVALEGRFGLEFLPGSGLPDEVAFYSVRSASERRVSNQTESFQTWAEGGITMLATGDGYGVDYVVLQVRPVDEIVVVRSTGDAPSDEVTQETDTDTDGQCAPWECDEPGGSREPSLFVHVGEVVRFEAIAQHAGSRLAGALDFDWVSLTPDTLQLSNESQHRGTFRGLEAGEARVQVSTGDVTTTVELVVYEPPTPPPDPPPPDPTGGTTTGGETDTDGDTDGGSGDTGSGTDGASTGTGGDTDGSSSTGGAR